jgi:Ca2+-binding RTX toxin-like protein
MSRRALVLLAAMAVMVALFVTAAYAAAIMGTDQADKLYESQRSDVIKGLRAADTLRADRFGFDTDRLSGGKGRYLLNARDGDSSDTLNGGDGADKCVGDQGDTFDSSCEIISP